MADTPAQLHAEVEKYERKHAENPEGRNFVPLANAYRKMGEFELAERLLREGLRLHPDYLSAHIVLGRTLADRGAGDEAAAEFRHVLGIDPQNLIALRTLGELAAGEGRAEEAEHWYRELLAVDPMNEEARRALAEMEPSVQPAEGFEPSAQWWSEPHVEISSTDAPSAAEPPAAEEEIRAAEGSDEGEEAELVDVVVPEWMRDLPSASAPAGEGEDAAPAELGSREDAPGGFVGVGPDALRSEEDTTGPQAAGDPLYPAPTQSPAGKAFHEELASETLAELYARQGFPDEAAEVYRELIRRRGEEAALVRRLAELEALAEHSGPEPPAVLVREGAEPVPVAGASFAVADAVEHAFADSFAFGFGGEEPASAAFAEQPPTTATSDAWVEPGSQGSRSELAGAEAGADVASEETGASPVAQTTAASTVAQYFAALLGWRPGAQESGGSEASAVPPLAIPLMESELGEAERAGVPEPWASPEPSAGPRAEAAAPVTEPSAEPDEVVARSAEQSAEDEERFPWELTEPIQPEALAEPRRDADADLASEETVGGDVGGAPAPAAEGAAPEAAEPPHRPIPTHALFDEIDDRAAAADAESPTAADRPPLAFGSSTADDDDDLESFQAWLRSLKR